MPSAATTIAVGFIRWHKNMIFEVAMYGYHLHLKPSDKRIDWIQKSFGDISPDWFIMENGVYHIRNLCIVDELKPLLGYIDFGLDFGLDLYGEPFDEPANYPSLLIRLDTNFANVFISLSITGAKEYIPKYLNILSILERVGGYITFDKQLQRVINLQEDVNSVIDAYDKYFHAQKSRK